MNPNAQKVIDACDSEWPGNQADCNKFVRAVGAKLRISVVTGNADTIIDDLRANWSSVVGGNEGKKEADAGNLVVAGLKAANHNPPRQNGHLAIVVSGPLDPTHKKYPTGYWGTLGGVGKQKSTLNYSWSPADRDNIEYFVSALP